MAERTKLFITYCYPEKRWLDRILMAIEPVVEKHRFVIWDERRLRMATAKAELSEVLASTRVAMMVVSELFLQSEFITRVKLPAVLDRERERGLQICWVLASHCLFQVAGLRQADAGNGPNAALDGLSTQRREAELAEIARKIARLMSDVPQPEAKAPEAAAPSAAPEMPPTTEQTPASVTAPADETKAPAKNRKRSSGRKLKTAEESEAEPLLLPMTPDAQGTQSGRDTPVAEEPSSGKDVAAPSVPPGAAAAESGRDIPVAEEPTCGKDAPATLQPPPPAAEESNRDKNVAATLAQPTAADELACGKDAAATLHPPTAVEEPNRDTSVAATLAPPPAAEGPIASKDAASPSPPPATPAPAEIPGAVRLTPSPTPVPSPAKPSFPVLEPIEPMPESQLASTFLPSLDDAIQTREQSILYLRGMVRWMFLGALGAAALALLLLALAGLTHFLLVAGFAALAAAQAFFLHARVDLLGQSLVGMRYTRSGLAEETLPNRQRDPLLRKAQEILD